MQTTLLSSFSSMQMANVVWFWFHWKVLPQCSINYNPALVQIMAWCRPGGKPLFEPMTIIFMTLIFVTRSQWFIPSSRAFHRKSTLSSEIFGPTQAVPSWLLGKCPTTSKRGIFIKASWHQRAEGITQTNYSFLKWLQRVEDIAMVNT